MMDDYISMPHKDPSNPPLWLSALWDMIKLFFIVVGYMVYFMFLGALGIVCCASLAGVIFWIAERVYLLLPS